MLSDLLEHQILINGTFAKIDVIRYNSPDDEDESDLLGIKPVYEKYIDRVWIDTTAVISIYAAGNPNHCMVYLSNQECWEAKYKRDLLADVIFNIKKGFYEPKKPGLFTRLYRYFFGR